MLVFFFKVTFVIINVLSSSPTAKLVGKFLGGYEF